MKSIGMICLTVGMVFLPHLLHAQTAGSFAVVEHGANYRVWQTTNNVGGTNRVHKYTELATGMYYTNSSGQWVESKEEIETFARGAIARQGPYQVIFANNLNTAGAIDVQTPDGKRLRSNILGLAYNDDSTGQSVLIAQIQNSQGELISSNQVLYPDAFDGVVKADVRYTYRKGSFEQDVILRTQPPAPESFGLNPQTTEIEVLTEFINPPAAKVAEHKMKGRLQNNSLPDDEVDWGVMRIGHGRAFDLGEPQKNSSRVAVRRQYMTAQNRNALVEGLSMQSIQANLANLPQQTSRAGNLPMLASKTMALPKTPLAQAGSMPMKLASASSSNKGFVLDWLELNYNISDYTFQGNTTYFVSGGVYISGTATFEGGTILKFPEDVPDGESGIALLCHNVVCDTTAYNPAVFTSQNDNSVGDGVDGSSGHPVEGGNDYIECLNYFELDHCQFRYAGSAVTAENSVFNDVQLLQCCYGFVGGTTAHNILATGCQWVFDAGPACDNCTFDQCVGICDNSSTFVNCIFSSDASIGYSYYAPSFSIDGSNNDFYNCASTNWFGDNQFYYDPSYQPGPLGGYYLSDGSPLIDVGSVTADQAGLYWWTTQTGVQAFEGFSPVDLGYHYPSAPPMSTLVSGVYDYISDPNGNGLPDAWEMQYFGNLNQCATTLDSVGRTFLYDYQHGINPVYSFQITAQPLSQNVCDGSMVTFSVATAGDTDLTYQWTFNGTPISGATSSSYTINIVQDSDAGDYTVIVSEGTYSVTSATAQLTITPPSPDQFYMALTSQRTDYTFKSGVTYYIGSSIPLFGNTTIEGGAILKFDWYDNASLQIKGTLTCTGGPYNPAILTSVDDDTTGEQLIDPYTGSPYSYEDNPDGPPQTYPTGVPYLEMADAQSDSVSNLRICYADGGVSTPAASRRLDVWDCQFLQCNYGVVNLLDGTGSVDSLHNVLFSNPQGVAVGAVNAIAIEAEQVTADVGDFCQAATTPEQISLVNSIIMGNPVTATSLSTVDVQFNPDRSNFQSVNAGNYYLAANSTFHKSGTASISQRLQTELQSKTTYAPVSIAPFAHVTGQMTLSPQAQRYTGGAPDLGYYYDALDYTVADMILDGGTLTVLPGTAIGCRFDYGYDDAYGDYFYTFIGFDVSRYSSVVSQGTPARPNIFVDVQLVQEQFQLPVWAVFVPDFYPGTEGNQPPALNFRFSNFYLNYAWYVYSPAFHFWSGFSEYNYPDEWSHDSLMNFTLQDCCFHGGQIDLGPPDDPNSDWGYIDFDSDYIYGSGAVSWINNTFENVGIILYPTYYPDNGVVNCDMQVVARNNLFKNLPWLILEPNPSSAGNWVFTDNLFDKVQFHQDPTLPLDYSYNGYWPLLPSEVLQNGYGFTAQLQPTATSDGSHEVTLASAPPYQSGPFGNYYLPDTTALHGAGSRTPAAAGLYHYTTRLDQVKEGEDTSKTMVNIGLHYVATSSSTSTTPRDTDGDGIPDYVEDANGNGVWDQGTETDWQNAQTISGTPDASNAIYDDVDLDGDGLTGRAERILRTNPLVPDNPLTLTPVITGQEPYILTYSMPLSVDVNSSNCVLTLLDNGDDAGAYDFVQQGNGTCLVEWNTTFAANGSHVLQVGLDMPGYALPKNAGGVQPVLSVGGNARLENVNNIIQLDVDDVPFGNQAVFSGTLAVQSADYEIDIFDTNNVPLNTITGHTDSGTLYEVWDLTDYGGETCSDDEFDVQIYITPTANSNASQANVQANGLTPYGPIPVWKFKSGSCDDLFSLAYGWDAYSSERSDMVMNGVENVIFNPTLNNEYTPSPLNFPGWFHAPFFMHDLDGSMNGTKNLSDDEVAVVNDLASLSVGNFYWHGHGSHDFIGSGTGVGLGPSVVANRLKNYYGKRGGNFKHPYRLVILEACNTGDNLWVHAFGIESTVRDAAWFQAHGESPQAMLAWPGMIAALGGSMQLASHSEHLADFFGAWMSGHTLVECAVIGSTPNESVSWPFDQPMDPNWTMFGDPFLTRSP